MKNSCWIGAVFAALALGQTIPDNEWPVYGRDPGGSKYSPLSEIDRTNVKDLKIAWTFRTGDMYDPNSAQAGVVRRGQGRPSAFEATPLFVENVLYLSTPFGRVIALDPESGKQRWAFDPHSDITAGYGDFANRGVATWVDSVSRQRRIFVATIDARLFAVNAASGVPCTDFGKAGQVDLRTGLRNPPINKSEYEETSPPAVIGDLVIVGSGIADNTRVTAPSGEVRAFDARTGKLRWTWDPMPGQRTGAANAWSILSVDPQRKLVFIPTGSASPDYYGGERPGDNLYANSVVALRAETGAMVWHFQTVHHDLWDYDVASQPALITVRKGGGNDIAAIAVGSKTGHLFILDRETGKPIFGVEERPVPKSNVAGEQASPTQPWPVLPAPLVPESLKPEDAWGVTPADRKWCGDRIQNSRSEGIFTPPSLEGSVIFPGNVGGMAWGGAAFDPKHGLLVVPTNRLAALIQLYPRKQYDAMKKEGAEFAPQLGTPYGMSRQMLLTPAGLPCNAPPWGVLAAIDLSTGAKKWEVPIGFVPKAAAHPNAGNWGSPSLGGPIVTGGGLVFMAGTLDANIRAFDVETGVELWKAVLPTSARATPMTYRAANGKQYVVIAAGGFETDGWKQGDYLVAFALP